MSLMERIEALRQAEGRLWWPACWGDEVMPPGRPTPDEFLIRLDDGRLQIGYADDATDVSDDDRAYFSQPVKDGDIVRFTSCDHLGLAKVFFTQNGGYHIVEGAEPPEANWCRIEIDNDTISESLEQLAGVARESFLGDDFHDSHTVSFARWSEVSLRLQLAADGPRFVMVSDAEARQ